MSSRSNRKANAVLSTSRIVMPWLQHGMLVEIADADIFCPLYSSLIRHQLSR